MKMYLLLRNNKQSGPHSLDELKSMGLKAYDLVWLEGKSAAWRYPSELEELSAFAPIVEEQPFDRFYKKASAAVPSASGENDNGRNVSVRTMNELPPAIESQRSSSLSNPLSSPMSSGKRIIYVTMPAGKSPASRETVIRENQREAAIARELPPGSAVREMPGRETVLQEPHPGILPLRETHPEIQPPREPVLREMPQSYARAAIEDYAAPTAAAQRPLLDQMPRRQSSRTALKHPKTRAITRFAAIGLCILALLAVGIFIGLSLNRDTLGLPHRMVANEANANSRNENSRGNSRDGSAVKDEQPLVHPTAQQLPVPAATPPSVSTRERYAGANNQGHPGVNNIAAPAKTTKVVPPPSRTKERPTHQVVQEHISTPPQKEAVAAAITSMPREAVHRSDNAETNRTSPVSVDKEAMRAAMANQISVGANTYSVGTFGGISDLQVTVTNRSAYALDLVVVEVAYVQANKKVFKTENLYFHGIGAGSALMLEAPKSTRGIKVQTKVTTINSRELGLPGV